jgi:hypothetical protein
LEVVLSVSKKPLKEKHTIVTHKTSILWSAATTIILQNHSTKHCISIPDNLNDKQELGMYKKVPLIRDGHTTQSNEIFLTSKAMVFKTRVTLFPHSFAHLEQMVTQSASL